MENESQGTTETTTAKKAARLIYIGPHIPGGLLLRYQVFKGGIPEHLDDLIEKCPAVKSLFVPVANFATAEQALGTTGSVENVMYIKVVQYFKKGAK